MLEWATPLWFAALPFALLAPWLARRPRLQWSSLAAVTDERSARVVFSRLPELMASLGLALLVVALARPQMVERSVRVDNDGIDILLVLDTSGSMDTADYRVSGSPATRMSVAKKAAARFIEGRPTDRLGLVVFGEEAFTQVPLTLDHDALLRFLDEVDSGVAGERATAIGDGLAVAAKRLKDLKAKSKVVVLVTDGRNNAGQIAPLAAADVAAALGIKVYTVGIGSTEPQRGFFGMARSGNELDERTLSAIAKKTDGKYFRAGDADALEEVYATIDKMEKSKADVVETVHADELFRPWAASGLLLLLVQMLLGHSILRRLP